MDGNAGFMLLLIVGLLVVGSIGIDQIRRTKHSDEPAQDHEPLPATKPLPVVTPTYESVPSQHLIGIPIGATGRRAGRFQSLTPLDDTPLHTASMKAISAGTSTDNGDTSSHSTHLAGGSF